MQLRWFPGTWRAKPKHLVTGLSATGMALMEMEQVNWALSHAFSPANLKPTFHSSHLLPSPRPFVSYIQDDLGINLRHKNARPTGSGQEEGPGCLRPASIGHIPEDVHFSQSHPPTAPN